MFQLRALREEEDADWLSGPLGLCLRFGGDVVRNALLERVQMLERDEDVFYEMLAGLEEGYPGDPEVRAVVEALPPWEWPPSRYALGAGAR